MTKHIAPPATAEQIMQALGVTQEDREIIDRVLKEVDEEEEAEATRSSVQTPIRRPDPEDDTRRPKTGPKS
ncbi:MAG: hypothetical protein WAM82_01785 [Thermoanaerobaculia bacterium]